MSSTLRTFAAAVATAALALSAAGCSSDSSGSSSSSKGSSNASAAAGGSASASSGVGEQVVAKTLAKGKGSDATDGTFPRTVNHYAGSTVVKAAPTKVAVLSTGQADALLTLGVTPSGSTAARKTTAVPTYLSNAFPAQKSALNTMADLGSRTSPDIESIAKMKPDLILVNKAGKNSDELYKSLTKIAPTVVTQGTGTHWKEDFLFVADAVGKRQQAEKWLTDYQKDAADYGASVSNKPTISLLRRNDGTQRVFGVASFAGSVVQDAGLTRPSSQLFSKKVSQDISDENIDKADGGELFYGIQSGGKASDLTSLPLWPSLKAVSEKKAVEVDDDMFFLNAGPTAARGVLDALKKQIG